MTDGDQSDQGQGGDGACSGNDNPDTEQIRADVKARFAALAASPAAEQRFQIGRESALKLGYGEGWLDELPEGCVARFAGVGCPVALAPIAPGAYVVDVGCGAGMDCLLVSRLVGDEGRVVGVDSTPEMVALADRYRQETDASNVHFVVADAEELPLPDHSADVVISNGVLNLCTNKSAVLAELYRVLRPGGRLQASDVLVDPGVEDAKLRAMGTWSD